MSKRVDSESRFIRASAETIYRAFATADAMTAWLPPEGMAATMLDFEFVEGSGYHMELTYQQPHHTPGKTSEQADEVHVRLLKLVPNERIEQAVTFATDDPVFAGEMRMQWVLEQVEYGTLVTVRCEDVPSGISAADHEAGLKSTLSNLTAYAQTSA